MERRDGIDIIIPVYNALEDLKLCVSSIKRHTDLTLDRVILIDDKSPDQNIFPYMKSIEEPGLVVLQNEQNQGFSGTINRGILYSDRDVILLNSDTVVTAGWVDKIVACAYSDPAIGTVTPFSNNATLCSVPNFCEENTIPYGLSIDAYAKVIEHCSMKKYPRITVAVGFCMFIKREVIKRTGLFDKETFQRGYGEENDFCWRAEQLGYHHVLCDDTYIYHSGSMSFLSEDKKKLIAEHEQILQNRYPNQNHGNAVYVRDNPHQYLRDNISIYAPLQNGKKNILYVIHADFRADAANNVGGTQLHVKDLSMNLRKSHNVFVMSRDRDFIRLTAYLEKEEICFKFAVSPKREFQPFTNRELSEIFTNILKAFSIDAVHIHHTIDLSFDVFHVTKKLGIPLIATLHDYYYICPTIKLLENGTNYCGGCGEDCAACIHKELGYVEGLPYLNVWREECKKALMLCDLLITPSQAAKEIYQKNYPEIGAKIRVMTHGMDAFAEETTLCLSGAVPGVQYNLEQGFADGYTIKGWAIHENADSRSSEVVIRLEDAEGTSGEFRTQSVCRPDLVEAKSDNRYLYGGFEAQIPDTYFQTGDLKAQLFIQTGEQRYCSKIVTLTGYEKQERKNKRIAFIGGLTPAKGSQLAYQMIKQSGNKYDWYIIGGIGDVDLAMMERANLHKTGWYKRENIGSILRQNKVDLVCILPIWPETFCYTVSEAELAGVPILATNMGALGERLKKDETGWVVEYTMSAREILHEIDGIFADEKDFERKQQNCASFCHKTIAQMCDEYAKVYEHLPAVSWGQCPYDAELIYTAYTRCHGGSYDQNNSVLMQRITELESTLVTIEQSLEYRMARFLNRENIPFKRQIKWMIRAAYRIYVKYFKK